MDKKNEKKEKKIELDIIRYCSILYIYIIILIRLLIYNI